MYNGLDDRASEPIQKKPESAFVLAAQCKNFLH
jgi:hypothetical protein